MKTHKIIFYIILFMYGGLFLIQMLQSYFIISVQVREVKSGVASCMSQQYRSDHQLLCQLYIEKDTKAFLPQVISHTFENFRWCIVYDKCNDGLAFNTISWLSIFNTLFSTYKMIL